MLHKTDSKQISGSNIYSDNVVILDLSLDQQWGSAGVDVSFYFTQNQGF